MRKLIFLSGISMLLAANVVIAGNKPVSPEKPTVKKVVVYTTAENTNLRISQTETVQFVDFGQPK